MNSEKRNDGFRLLLNAVLENSTEQLLIELGKVNLTIVNVN